MCACVCYARKNQRSSGGEKGGDELASPLPLYVLRVVRAVLNVEYFLP